MLGPAADTTHGNRNLSTLESHFMNTMITLFLLSYIYTYIYLSNATNLCLHSQSRLMALLVELLIISIPPDNLEI
jgi:hypothetical protein